MASSTGKQIGCKCLSTSGHPKDHAMHCPVSPDYANFKLRVNGFQGVSVTGGHVRHFIRLPWVGSRIEAICGKRPRQTSEWHENNVILGDTCDTCQKLYRETAT
jgi:hypothetical protein